MKSPDPNVILRQYRPADRAVVCDVWLQSYYKHASQWLGWIGFDAFRALYMPIICALLDRSRVRVACLRDDESAVVGWLCMSDKLLHYVWVRAEWRRSGLGTWLAHDLAADAMHYTHETEAGRQWVRRFPGWEYAAKELRRETRCVCDK